MQKKSNPSLFHQTAYFIALIYGGYLGYQIGGEYGGVILAIFLALIGAVGASTLVGFIAVKIFGYEP